MKEIIYKQDAINAFNCADELIVSGNANAQNVTNYINKVISKIEALPPIQPERKKGKWISLVVRHGWVCSNCKKEDAYAFFLNEKNGKLDYEMQDFFCPHCGADMRDEQDK